MSDNSNASPWKDPAIWGRVVFVVLFLLIFALIVGPLAAVLGVVQALFAIFTGEENRNLRGLAAALAEYIREILLFASWNREQRPFPFSEFPRVAEQEDAEAAGEPAADFKAEPESAVEEPVEEVAPKEPAKKKATRRKSSTKKAAAEDTEG